MVQLTKDLAIRLIGCRVQLAPGSTYGTPFGESAEGTKLTPTTTMDYTVADINDVGDNGDGWYAEISLPINSANGNTVFLLSAQNPGGVFVAPLAVDANGEEIELVMQSSDGSPAKVGGCGCRPILPRVLFIIVVILALIGLYFLLKKLFGGSAAA